MSAIDDVVAERVRQVLREGWSAEHDDQHATGDMARAAAAYAIHGLEPVGIIESIWPWEARWWKPKDARHNLVRAAALLIAEIERLDRAEARK